jgi:hypothetical protein
MTSNQAQGAFQPQSISIYYRKMRRGVEIAHVFRGARDQTEGLERQPKISAQSFMSHT